jgi:hypothetical protein
MNLYRLIAFSLTMAVVALANARIPVTTLEDLARQSDAILIGEVTEIADGPLSEHYGVATKSARVEVMTIAKGNVQRKIVVTFEPSISEQPHFALGKKYLLFLKSSPPQWRVAVGNLGAREVIDGRVNTEGLADEPRQALLDSVMARLVTKHK